MKYNILLIDDDKYQKQLVQNTLSSKIACDISQVTNGEDALDLLTGPSASDNIDLVILDLNMPGTSGIDILRQFKPTHPEIPVVIRTGEPNMESAIETLKFGADDYISKIDKAANLYGSVYKLLKENILHDELLKLRRVLHDGVDFDNILGNSEVIKGAIKDAKEAASFDTPVIIKGKDGSGREDFAAAIYTSCRRNKGPFVQVKCDVIPENIFNEILFGCTVARKLGKIKEANKGLLVLYNIESMPRKIQDKLADCLSNKLFSDRANKKQYKSDIRIIAIASDDIESKVKAKKFNQQLYDYINMFKIEVPSLEQRTSDIEDIANFWLKYYGKKEGKSSITLSDESMNLIKKFNWVSNIRQLKNVLLRAVIYSNTDIIDASIMKKSLKLEDNTSSGSSILDIIDSKAQEAANENIIFITDDKNNIRSFTSIEKELIEKALKLSANKISLMSRKLKLGRSTLYRKFDQYGIDNKNESKE